MHGGEVGVGVFLLWDRNRWSKAKSLEGLLDEDVSDTVEGRVNELQRAPAVQIPERRQGFRFVVNDRTRAEPSAERVNTSRKLDSRLAPESELLQVKLNLSLPVVAEGGEFIHVAAVDLG